MRKGVWLSSDEDMVLEMGVTEGVGIASGGVGQSGLESSISANKGLSVKKIIQGNIE